MRMPKTLPERGVSPSAMPSGVLGLGLSGQLAEGLSGQASECSLDPIGRRDRTAPSC